VLHLSAFSQVKHPLGQGLHELGLNVLKNWSPQTGTHLVSLRKVSESHTPQEFISLHTLQLGPQGWQILLLSDARLDGHEESHVPL